MVVCWLVCAGTVSGGLAAIVVWLGWSVVLAIATSVGIGTTGSASSVVIIGLIAAVVLDGMVLVTGGPNPPRLERQVPQEWGRLLDPSIVAVLYGSRLGVGPLTMLSTWMWWAAIGGGAMLGPLAAVSAGATFGLVRLAVIVVASLVAPRNHADHFARLRRHGIPARAGLLSIAGITLAAGLAGCSAAGPDRSAESVAVGAASTRAATQANEQATHREAAGRQPAEPLIEPAALEDVVRTATDRRGTTQRESIADPMSLDAVVRSDQQPDGLTDTAPQLGDRSAEPDALADVIVPSISGFRSVDEPAADRFLDLTAASELQPDPLEEVALLETRGFRGGWTRAFRSVGNDIAVVSVYHFKDSGQAEYYLEDGLITIGGYGGSFFDIEGLPGVRGFRQEFEDGDESVVSMGAVFHVGPRWYLVYLVGSPETTTPDVLIPAVISQQNRAHAVDGPAN